MDLCHRKNIMKTRTIGLAVVLASMSLMAYAKGSRQVVHITKTDNTVEKINVEDIKSMSFNPTPAADGYQSVDLGLSVEWATTNVDLTTDSNAAEAPEAFGGYYGWGDPTGTHQEQPENSSMSPYEADKDLCLSYYGGTDPMKDICGTEYDIARVNWGGEWRLPSRAEQDELREKCTWTLENLNGKKGYRVTGPNGNSIFLPGAGFRYAKNTFKGDYLGYYWSGTLNPNPGFSAYAYALDFTDAYHEWFSDSRFYGQSVRPVRNASDVVIEKKNGEKVVFRIDEVASITIEEIVFDDDYYETVDLGLSVRWAAVNLDIDTYDYAAPAPEVAGGYYGWGDATGLNKSEDSNDYLGFSDIVSISGTDNDIVQQFWGGAWRLPTMEEMQELREKCQWTWTQKNDVNGYEVTGPNGNSIFLPACGFRTGTTIQYIGTHGYYWTGTNVSSIYCYNLGFSNTYFYEYNYRHNGFQIRGVRQ